MSSFEDPEDDSDDPLAPPRERLTKVIPQNYKKESPKPQSSRTKAWLKKKSSRFDRSIAFNLNSNRPDLQDELEKTVLPNINSSPRSATRRNTDSGEEAEDPDEIAWQKITEAKMEKMKEESAGMLNLQSNMKASSPPLCHMDRQDDKMARTNMSNSSAAIHQTPPIVSNKASIGLNITVNRDAFVRPSLRTALPRPLPAISHRKNSLPPGMGTGTGNLQSPATEFTSDAPMPDTRLAPIQSPISSPAFEGPSSPQANIKLAPIESLFRLADTSQMNINRQRQKSMSALSSMTAPSPPYTYSALISPFHSSIGQSPSATSGSATSPREWTHHLPLSAATSPSFGAPYSPFKPLSQATEPFPPLNLSSTVPETYSVSPDATSPGTLHDTSVTSPSERSAIMSRDFQRPLPQTLPQPSASNGPLQDSPHSEVTNPHSKDADRTDVPKAKGALLPAFELGQRTQTESAQPQATGIYRCDHPGCDAPPFHTQYLLNSHATVHSDSRPHYCPVEDCNRSIKGQGFKRKNEMIRHQLVHESPGYVCPYCPSREHRYPRPDNLQRHVRVHHADVPLGDPRLREVLDRKQSGRGNGRRRKSQF